MNNQFTHIKKMNTKNNTEVKILPLGGMGDVTKNMYVYESGDTIMVVDCGIGFPDIGILGVDVVIPDITYLKENQHKIKGFVITHGHEDHFGALPYIIPQLRGKQTIYCTKLVKGFIENKLAEHRLLERVDIRLLDLKGKPISIGNFSLSAFRVNHSVPDTAGFVFDTPSGIVVHVSDFKFDWTPVDGKEFDVKRLAKLIENKPVLLLSDTLGSLSPGYAASEKDIEKTFDQLLDVAPGEVYITTTSSNISRIQQAINSAVSHNRKVGLFGKSVETNCRVAQELGYLEIPKGSLVKASVYQSLPKAQKLAIVAGGYGQKGSALYRAAANDHKYLSLKKDDTVIFSSDPNPPGVKDAVDGVITKLVELGADVHFYEIQENLHVSGHGNQGDILQLAKIVDPQYFIPIGGSFAHMRGYTKLMEKAGYNSNQVFELANGETVKIFNGKMIRGQKITIQEVFVDGKGIGDVGTQVLNERQTLSDSGVVVLSLPIKSGKLLGKVEVTTRGFVFVRESSSLIIEISEQATKLVEESLKQNYDNQKLRKHLENRIGNFIFKKTERDPLVLVIITRINENNSN